MCSSDLPLPLDEALGAVADHACARYDEGVRLVVRLNIDARVAAQTVRSSTVLPHAVGGPPPRVGVFVDDAAGEVAAAATAAGADIVGDARLAAELGRVKGRGFAKGAGAVAIALAEAGVAADVARAAGKVLGTRGLLPLAKQGTLFVGAGGAAAAVARAKGGAWAFFRNDAGGNVHLRVGRVSGVPGGVVRANVLAAVAAVVAAKPAGVKKRFVLALSVSSDMGPGVPVVVEDVLGALEDLGAA